MRSSPAKQTAVPRGALEGPAPAAGVRDEDTKGGGGGFGGGNNGGTDLIQMMGLGGPMPKGKKGGGIGRLNS